MKPSLFQILLSDSNGMVYNESLPFRIEPTKEDIIGFIKLIRPSLNFIEVVWVYKRELKEIEL